jgi:electron transfer flavoprotein beta subunit
MSQITVLVAPRRHPTSQRLTRCQADATAATLALGLSMPVRLLCAGPMPDAVARDYLALGAPRIEILECPKDAPLLDALLPALHDVALVLTGTRSETDQASGVLPYALAAALGRPVVADVLSVEADGSGWIVTQALPKGARRRLKVQAPAVLVISAAAPVTLRHSLADAVAGKIIRTPVPVPHRPPPQPSPEGGGSETEPCLAPSPLGGGLGWGPDVRPSLQIEEGKLVPTRKRRQLLEAKTVQSGHARMLGAIDTPSTGGVVLQTGSVDSKAQAVLDYLRTHSLVTF